ncbi:MAG: ROK family protein [Duncaniella sp.]|nr:ROK family protein [Duncaniella sp.]
MTKCLHDSYAVGADIGGSHICSAVVNLTKGTICTEPIITMSDCNASASAILDTWQNNIASTIRHFGNKICNVGLAIPGPFDYINGISLIRGVNKYDNIYGLNVKLSLSDRLRDAGVRNIKFVNDASAFALGESLGGAGSDRHRIVALTLGTGVGSGFVLDRHLVENGEEVPPNGWVYNLPFENGIADEAFSTRWICRRYYELTGTCITGAKEVSELCASDDCAKKLFEEYGKRLATFAYPLLKRFSSDTLLLGGNISKAHHHFGTSLTQTFESLGYKVDVRISTLLDKAALIGSASLFI